MLRRGPLLAGRVGARVSSPPATPITASWLSWGRAGAAGNKEGFEPSFQGLGLQHGSFIIGFQKATIKMKGKMKTNKNKRKPTKVL